MPNWKNLERKAAQILNGKRNSRGMDFSLSMPDVEHPLLSIECKYRKKISGFLKDGLKQAEKYHQPHGVLQKPIRQLWGAFSNVRQLK